MALHVFVFPLVVCLLLSGEARASGLVPSPAFFLTRRSQTEHAPQSVEAPLPRRLPRLLSRLHPPFGGSPAPVHPWGEVKSRRGASKRVNTGGYACQDQQCLYCGTTDAHNHALVGDGKHGPAERIQTFRCQACHTTFSTRRDTPLHRLKTPSQQIAMVLSALAERLDPSAAERVFGYRQATITKCSGKRRPAWTASSQKTDPKWIGKGLADLSTMSHRSTDVQVMRRQK